MNSFLCSSSVSFMEVTFQIRTGQVDKLGVSCGFVHCPRGLAVSLKSCARAGLGAQLPELLPITCLSRALHQHPGWHPGNSFKNIRMSCSKLKRPYKGISPHTEGYQHNRKSDKGLSDVMGVSTIKKRSIKPHVVNISLVLEHE